MPRLTKARTTKIKNLELANDQRIKCQYRVKIFDRLEDGTEPIPDTYEEIVNLLHHTYLRANQIVRFHLLKPQFL